MGKPLIDRIARATEIVTFPIRVSKFLSRGTVEVRQKTLEVDSIGLCVATENHFDKNTCVQQQGFDDCILHMERIPHPTLISAWRERAFEHINFIAVDVPVGVHRCSDFLLRDRCLTPNHLRYHIPRQVLDELAHSVQLLAARGTAHDYHSSTAVSNRRWLINERVPRMPSQFGLN